MSWYNPLSWYSDFYYWYYCTPAVKAAVDGASIDNEGTLDFFGIPKVDLNETDALYIAEKIKANPNFKTLKLDINNISIEGRGVIEEAFLTKSNCEQLVTSGVLVNLQAYNNSSLLIDNLISDMVVNAAKYHVSNVMFLLNLDAPNAESNIEKAQELAAEYPSLKVFINHQRVAPAEKKVEEPKEKVVQPVGGGGSDDVKDEQQEIAQNTWLDKLKSLELGDSPIELIKEYFEDQSA
ncbi:MAG: hypothetical protein K0R73_1347 [Candidatus Midichloriaceae bacterium]|jgi:hypothetical protein|nr:hypothetical protein [Candidatus Midichloriaceae bacterium]